VAIRLLLTRKILRAHFSYVSEGRSGNYPWRWIVTLVAPRQIRAESHSCDAFFLKGDRGVCSSNPSRFANVVRVVSGSLRSIADFCVRSRCICGCRFQHRRRARRPALTSLRQTRSWDGLIVQLGGGNDGATRFGLSRESRGLNIFCRRHRREIVQWRHVAALVGRFSCRQNESWSAICGVRRWGRDRYVRILSRQTQSEWRTCVRL